MSRLYLDMDGVLCHFDKRARETWGFEIDPNGWYDISDDHWKMIYQNTEFWSHMDWQPGGQELWEISKSLDPWILTAYNPMVMRSTIIGKLDWVERELGIPIWKMKLTMREDKHHFATNLNGTRNILVDDNRKNIKEWEQAGGIGIFFDQTNINAALAHVTALSTNRLDLTAPAALFA